jgi:hypothetical protein
MDTVDDVMGRLLWYLMYTFLGCWVDLIFPYILGLCSVGIFLYGKWTLPPYPANIEAPKISYHGVLSSLAGFEREKSYIHVNIV